MHRRGFLYGATVGLGAWVVSRVGPAGAGPVTTDAIGDQVQTLPRGQLPVFARSRDVQRLYRYAVEQGHELQYMPCFCGCHRFGHTSNRDCYIKSFNADGTLTFTSHAATWAVCLDVTRDVMGMRSHGKSLAEIRRVIDAKYPGATPTPTPYPKDWDLKIESLPPRPTS